MRQAVPGIRVAGPEVIDRLLSLPELAGKDDRQRTRLHQYRVLEQKLVDRGEDPGTNEAFLRSCDIRIGVFTDSECEGDRLFELVNRTNQLNFTKRRPDREEFDAMLADTRRSSGYIRVRDRYGDYGICGFYSIAADGAALTDFLFSCRILNMGVEQWVYDHLGRPPVSVVGEVVATLDGSVDWITRDDALFDADTYGSGAPRPRRRSPLHPALQGPDGRRVRPDHRRALPRRRHRLGVLPHRTDRGLHLRRPHRDPPPVGLGHLGRAAGPGGPHPLPRPGRVRLAGRGRPGLRRAGVQRADRLHPGPLPAPRPWVWWSPGTSSTWT